MAVRRRSRQREAVLQVLSQKGYHPTAEEVLIRVRREVPNVSLGTIYRNLDQLCESGLVWKIPISDGPCRYEGGGDDHLHALCPLCGSVRDVWPKGDPLDRAALPPEFTHCQYRLLLISPCERCEAFEEADSTEE